MAAWARMQILLLLLPPAGAVVIDRIAVVADSRPIKDSDIERSLRVTAFLNGDTVNLSEPERKKSAQRLIDQVIIRREVEVGNYARATPAEVDAFVATIFKQRSRDLLEKYGLTEGQLRAQLTWQLTVLRFIEQRFRPAVLVAEEDVDKYLLEHAVQYREQKPADAREAVREVVTGERVNEAFNHWLEITRKRIEIEYHEAGLQ